MVRVQNRASVEMQLVGGSKAQSPHIVVCAQVEAANMMPNLEHWIYFSHNPPVPPLDLLHSSHTL